MKNLVGRLLDQSSGSLRRVAAFWDVRITSSATHEDVFYLCREMLDERSGRRLLEKLSAPEVKVLRYLLSKNNYWAYTADVATATSLDEEQLGLIFSKFQQIALAFLEDVSIKGNRMIFGPPSSEGPLDDSDGHRRMISVPRELGRLLQDTIADYDAPASIDASNEELLDRIDMGRLERIARSWGVPAPTDPTSKDDLVAVLAHTISDPWEIARMIKEMDRALISIYRLVRQHGGKMLLTELREESKLDEDAIRRLLRGLADRFIVLETYDAGRRALFIPKQIREAKNKLRVRTPQLSPCPNPTKVAAVAPFALPQDMLAFLSLATNSDANITAGSHLPKRLAKRLAEYLSLNEEDPAMPYLNMLYHASNKLGLLSISNEQLTVTSGIDRWVGLDFTSQLRQLYRLWLADNWWHEPIVTNELWCANWAAVRTKIVEWLKACRQGTWYSIDSLVEAVQTSDPFFMRSKQDIVRCHGYKGLENLSQAWGAYEGILLRGIITTAAHWLGLVELGSDNGGPFTSFRTTEIAEYLLTDNWSNVHPHNDSAALIVQPNFELMVLNAAPQLTWRLLQFTNIVRRDRVNVYALTKESVQRGLDRGLTIEKMLSTLQEHSQKDIPQNIAYTLEDWGRQFKEISLHRVFLIEADDPVVLDELLANKVLQGYQVRRLSRTAASVTPPDGNGKSKDDEITPLARELRKTGYFVRNSSKTVG